MCKITNYSLIIDFFLSLFKLNSVPIRSLSVVEGAM